MYAARGVTLNASYSNLKPASSVSPTRQALDAIPWLDAGAATREALAAQAMLHRLPAGALAFDQAETPAFALFLLAGSLKLVGVRGETEAVIEIVRPFDLVLPAAVVTGQPYLLRARVFEEAQLLLIGAEAFRAALVSDNAFCRAALAFVSSQLRRQVRATKGFRMRNAEERVAAYLIGLLSRDEGEEGIALTLDKGEIAAHLGMTRETFSRALTGLSAYGLRVEGRRLSISDVAAFRARFPSDPFIDGPEPATSSQL
jgi:CRP/FNR family transcriptional activator FtrB